ncbi:hypothetical protein [Methylomonas sp. DH-1]|uniref:hypothetical protein n=1 Tax=Methylomonas sp. (strain DH-1) TaxID=1727196 RepID=UPI0007C8AAC0|nr:hypothetical protein [Methylomonas sp. DH-1]ANE54450.1 hypothetical protein AYM39_04100 [Methylomonas sp. DH-1]
MDLTQVPALLGSIKTAFEITKMLRETDASLEKAESKMRLAELISTLADAKIEVTEIQQVLLNKDAEIRELQEKLKIKAQLQWERPYYWRVGGNEKDGPYCQHCYDKNQELIRLQGNGEGYWHCTACKNEYKTSSYSATITTVAFSDDRYHGY